MKKYLAKLFIGVVIVVVLDIALGSIMRHYYFSVDSGLFQRTTFAMEETTADILIFGASRANHHYNTKIIEDRTGTSVYNTGRNGNYIFYQMGILKAVLERYTPKHIVLDFTGTFKFDQQDYDKISSLLPYYKTHPEIHACA